MGKNFGGGWGGGRVENRLDWFALFLLGFTVV